MWMMRHLSKTQFQIGNIHHKPDLPLSITFRKPIARDLRLKEEFVHHLNDLTLMELME